MNRSNKVGRNDPCPCGSGKKLKHCCQTDAQHGSVRSGQPFTQEQLANALQVAYGSHRHGNLAQAESICQQIVRVAPSQPDALHLLGVIALQQGNLNVAIPLFRRALKVLPQHPEYLGNLGFSLHERGDLSDAARYYQEALATAPDYLPAIYNQHALFLMQDKPKALACLEKVLRLNPQDHVAAYMLGALLEVCGKSEQAQAYLEKLSAGSQLDRSRVDAWSYLKSVGGLNLPITGSMMETFKLAYSAAPKDGLILEFGVRFGNTIRQIAMLARDRPVHGFDSFEGLPEVWHHEPKGSYTTKGEIPEVPENVTLHQGWFEDTLPAFLAHHAGPVCLANIDCDIYSSTKTVLHHLSSRIVVGSVLIFDEYIGNEHWREDEFKAFREAVEKFGWQYEYLCYSLFTKQVVIRITSVGSSS